MKRVAIIVPGGVGTGRFNQGIPALMNLIEGLAAHYDITVYSLIAVPVEFKPANYHIKAINASHTDWTAGRVLRLSGRIVKDHRRSNYDLFHGIWGMPAGSLAVLLGKLLKKPSIVSLQGGETAGIQSINYGYFINKRKKDRLFKTLRSTTAVTTLTHYQHNQLASAGYTADNISVIPYGVDTDLFKQATKSYAHPVHFLHISNLTEVKDQPTLLKAFKLIREAIPARLRVIGEDNLKGAIQQQCKALGLDQEVEFLGSVRHNDLPEHFDWAHILLHTSLYEAQAVVVAEAMASNVLVAGTKVGLISDLEEFTMASAVGDWEQLANNCLEILANPAVMNEKLQKAEAWTQTNDINVTIQRFATLYDNLVQP